MRVGITGGAGFIGGHTIEALTAAGHEVIVFDRSGAMTGPIKELVDTEKGGLFLGDVRDRVAVMELAAHVDGIIHLAACLGTQETITNPYPAAETNILGGLNFLEACAQYKIPGVYIGVGNHWMNNSYSITKTAVERFVHMYNKERGTHVNIVRAVNAFGPRQSVAPPYGAAKVRKITPAFVCRALTGAPIEIYGDGNQVSDMVDVRDVARVLVLALENAAGGNVFPEPVEVGPAVSWNVNQVAEYIRDLAWGWGFGPSELTHLPMRPGEIPGDAVTASVGTLRHVGLHHTDLRDVGKSLAETVEWYRDEWLPGYQGWLEDHLRTAKGAHGVMRHAGMDGPTEHPAHPGQTCIQYDEGTLKPIKLGAVDQESTTEEAERLESSFPAERAQAILATGDGSVAIGGDNSAPITTALVPLAEHVCDEACNPGNCPVQDF